MKSEIVTTKFTGVVRHQGVPVAGILVRICEPSIESGGLHSVLSECLGETRTDAKGTFKFDLSPGNYRVDVCPDSTTRFLSQSNQVRVGDNSTVFNISLNTGMIVKGRLLNELGVLANCGQAAFVGLEPTAYKTTASIGAGGAFTVTVPKGRYQFGLRGEAMPDPDAEEVNKSESFAAGTTAIADVQSDCDCELVLHDFITLRGEVVGAEGTPMSGAKVHVEPRTVHDRLLALELELGATCVTNDNGRFAIQAEPGIYELTISPPDGVQLFPIHEMIDLSKNISKKFALQKGHTLRGKVVFDDQELSGCLVRAENLDRDIEVIARTDKNGQFALNVPPGNCKLIVTGHPKDAPTVTIDGANYSGIAPWTRMVVVGKDTRVDVRLQQGTAVHGTIQDEKGKPRPGAKISFLADAGKLPVNEKPEHALVNGITDGDGHYCMFVSPGSYWLCVERDLVNATRVLVDAEPVKHDVRWRGFCRAKVVVQSEDGAPIPRCRVFFTPYGNKEIDLEADMTDEFIAHLGHGSGLTDSSGLSETTLSPNIYTLFISPHRDGSYEAKTIKQVSIASDWAKTYKLELKQIEESEDSSDASERE